LYGTQGGNARAVAQDLARGARRRRFVARLLDLKDFDVVRPPLFICA